MFFLVTAFCTDCSNRQTMEFSNQRISGWGHRRRPASTIIPQSTVPTRIPQPVVWRWRPHTHWHRCSTIPHSSWRNFNWRTGKFESTTANRRLLDARRSKRKFRCCERLEWWSGEAGFGGPPGRATTVTSTSGLTGATTIVSASDQGCNASFCKYFKLQSLI